MGCPPKGIVGLGEIGDNRDRILRDVGILEIDLGKSNDYYIDHFATRTGSFPPIASAPLASTNIPTHTGSISGTVARSPADFGIILLVSVDSLTPNFGVRGPTGAIPATLAGKNGAFVIRNVPPGIYVVTAGIMQTNVVVIEVKADEETEITEPLALPRIGGGGG